MRISTVKKREGQSTRRTNDSKEEEKKVVTIITVLVTTLVTFFFSIQEAFCCRKWQLRLVTPSKSELNEQKRKVNKALPACEIGFLHFIIIHVLLLALYSILFLCHSNFARSYIHLYMYCCAIKRKKKKNNNKRLKHKRSILSVVLVMINHNGVQLLNTVWYGCCGSNDDHKYPAVAFIRDDKENQTWKELWKTRLCHTTQILLWDYQAAAADFMWIIWKFIGWNTMDTAEFYNAHMWISSKLYLVSLFMCPFWIPIKSMAHLIFEKCLFNILYGNMSNITEISPDWFFIRKWLA